MVILAGGLVILLIVFFSKGNNLDINFFFFSYVFLFLLINLALFARLRFKQTRFNIPKEFDIQYRSYSIFNALVGVLINRLDLILVGIFLTPSDAGIYGIVLIFLFVLNTVIGVQATYWGPIFSRFHNSFDFIMLKKSYFVSKTYSRTTILIAAFFCYLLIEPSIIFLGSGYEDIANLILIRCGFQALALMLGIPGVFLSMTGNPQDQFERLVLGVIVTGVLGLILVPYYGLIGAAIAGGSGAISSAIIGELYARKLLHNQAIKI
jgi:O-antigen/teichoic acid export membrane protein